MQLVDYNWLDGLVRE